MGDNTRLSMFAAISRDAADGIRAALARAGLIGDVGFTLLIHDQCVDVNSEGAACETSLDSTAAMSVLYLSWLLAMQREGADIDRIASVVNAELRAIATRLQGPTS